jgi:glycosyltransferase involved in cell wall biosynthesis
MDLTDTIVLYDKHLEVLGGGEAHALRLFKSLIELSGKEGVVLSPSNITGKIKIQSKLGIELENVVFQQVPNLLDLPKDLPEPLLFINGTDRSLIRGRGKKNILLVFFPIKPSILKPIASPGSTLLSSLHSKHPHRVLSLGSNFLGKYKSLDALSSYDLILSNSEFTKNWIKEYWGKESEILYPPINTKVFENTEIKKNKIIAVGRFFKDSLFTKSHNKRHDVLIDAFKYLIDQNPMNETIQYTELHLVGSIGPNKRDQRYFEELKDMSRAYPIFFHLSPTLDLLRDLYKDSKVFWHATGFGIDDTKHPEQLEHFGMTTVEAMSAGCIPVVIDKGGQKEIIQNGINGFLWNDTVELAVRTKEILEDKVDTKALQQNALNTSQIYSIEKFDQRVKELAQKYKLLD